MCGIFGILSKSPVEPTLFHRLGTLNTERGNLGFGGMLTGADQFSVFRSATPFDAEPVQLNGATIVLGHVRAPTGGQSNDLATIHPFETDSLLLAHNGLLLNYRDFPAWQINPVVEVDSQVILGGIQDYLNSGADITSAIRSTVEQLDGQQACWLWHKPTRDLYVWRVMSPIYVGYEADRCIFSSIKGDTTSTLLDEGMIYRFNPTVRRGNSNRADPFYTTALIAPCGAHTKGYKPTRGSVISTSFKQRGWKDCAEDRSFTQSCRIRMRALPSGIVQLESPIFLTRYWWFRSTAEMLCSDYALSLSQER